MTDLGTRERTARRPATQLEELARAGSRLLRTSPAEDVVAWAAGQFGESLAVASSMSNGVLAHLVSRFVPGVDVLFLDTGYHFVETLGTRDVAEALLPITVVDGRAERSVAEQDVVHGARLYDHDPEACCRMRKVEPLARELAGYEAWVSGIRRDEAPTRLGSPKVAWDARHGLVKVNPLAAWTFDDLLDYADEHGVPMNPLLAEGYPSIGCAPCTIRVEPGEDPRSGRWAGLAKTECGIHR
jgi:phosphoadenosine phosphosulfate reductase